MIACFFVPVVVWIDHFAWAYHELNDESGWWWKGGDCVTFGEACKKKVFAKMGLYLCF